MSEEVDWLAIAESLQVPVDPEAERRAWAAQAAWAQQHNRTLMAVAGTLTEQEREMMLRAVAERWPALRGIEVADWLEIADNRDLFIAECAVTFDRWGEALVERRGEQARAVIGLATAAAAMMYPADGERMGHQAERIALDTLERLGV